MPLSRQYKGRCRNTAALLSGLEPECYVSNRFLFVQFTARCDEIRQDLVSSQTQHCTKTPKQTEQCRNVTAMKPGKIHDGLQVAL